MRLIILGPPGAGKGTQAVELAKILKLKHISPGEFLREEYKKKTKEGLAAYKYWSKGNLVPDNIIINITLKKLPKNNYILDGFPRTVYEAKTLEKTQPTDLVLYLTSHKEVIIKRLLHRAVLEGRRDDTLKVIKNRINVYHKRTTPVLTFYKKKLLKFEGNKRPEPILKEILKKIATYKKLHKTAPL